VEENGGEPIDKKGLIDIVRRALEMIRPNVISFNKPVVTAVAYK
jgi:hypothetical protein